MGERKPKVFHTVKEAYAFVFDNFGLFQKIFWPLFPALFVLYLPVLFVDQEQAKNNLLIFLPAYVALMLMTAPFWTALAATWHRAVIFGPGDKPPSHPFRLSAAEKRFAMLFVAIGVGFPLGILALVPIMGLLGTVLGKGLLLSLLVLVVFVGGIFAFIFFTLRASLYFPAKAAGADLSLGDCYHLSEGLVPRMFACSLLASIPIGIIKIIFKIIAVIVLNIAGLSLENVAGKVAFSLLSIPVVIADYLLAAIAVTILSRFYIWTVQNRTVY